MLEDVSPQICRHEDPTVLKGALPDQSFIQPADGLFTNNDVCCHLSQLLPALNSLRSVTAGQVSLEDHCLCGLCCCQEVIFSVAGILSCP